jgi:glycosyltransferase involved in cell wall biosynthesis
VPPDDPSALRDALAELLENHDRRAMQAAAARSAADGPYSWSEAARRTVEVYRKLR